jgi:hypothetical protein
MIPKTLHFTWKNEALPRVMRGYFEKWRALHGGWEIRLWTDATMREFVAEAYPQLLPTYDGYPKMIQRADAFRYMVLDRLGGIYSDLDVEPLRPVDELAALPDGFLGVEPLEHIGSDRIHAGLPFLCSNAFMGSRPGHPLWRQVLALMPELGDQETFYATGPSMLTAMVLRLAPKDRPALLLPKVWSPLRDGGLATRGDAQLKATLRNLAPLVESDGRAIVSHKWLTTWVQWHQRYTPLQNISLLPSRLRWRVRRDVLHPRLGRVRILDPLRLYTDQRPRPVEARASVFVGIRLDGAGPLRPGLATAIAQLDYPERLLHFAVVSGARLPRDRQAVHDSIEQAFPARTVGVEFTPEHEVGSEPASLRARANNRLLAKGAASAKVLLVGGGVRTIPPTALKAMQAVDRPVVAANLRDASGASDLSVFRYKWAPDFRILYKVGGLSGAVRQDAGFRYVPDQQRAFRLFALDGVGDDFVLIDSAVVRAGVSFAEEPYKLHRNGEAFGIMARDFGFEPAALTDLVVTKG